MPRRFWPAWLGELGDGADGFSATPVPVLGAITFRTSAVRPVIACAGSACGFTRAFVPATSAGRGTPGRTARPALLPAPPAPGCAPARPPRPECAPDGPLPGARFPH